jgi:serralysin
MLGTARAFVIDVSEDDGPSAVSVFSPDENDDLTKAVMPHRAVEKSGDQVVIGLLQADTVPGGPSTTATIALGSSVDVTIDTLGDHDWYGVTLTAGTAYTIHTSSDGISGADSFLTLREAGGAQVASDDDAGDGAYSLIGYTPSVTGTYYIDAGTYNDETTASYHLSIAPVLPAGADSVPSSTATTANLAITGSVDGNIDTSGDHDFYRVSLTAGQTYIFRTGGINASTTTDTILALRDAGGAQILTNDDSGEASFSAIRYTAAATGTYYLDVSGFSTGTGAFNLTAFTAPTPVAFTTDQIASQLTNGYWGGGSHHFGVTAGGSLTFNVQALTAAGQTLARAALSIWGDVTGIAFNEVTTGGQIVYDDNQSGAFANASYSGGITTSANVNVSTQWLSDYGTGLNTYSFQTYIHETGHALGLGHAGNYNGAASYAADSLYLNDSWATTVMSYFDQSENTYFQAQGFTREFVLTPMVADGVAVANLYGTATTTRTGNTTYGFNNNSGQSLYDATLFPTVSYTIYDNGGTDTLDYSGFSQNQVINLNAETFSNIGSRVGNVSIARGTVIENAIGGSGADTIIGNGADNQLTGNGGADLLYGNGGNDTLFAQVGDALLDGGTGTDALVFGASGTVTATLAGFEALQLTGGAGVTMTETQFNGGFDPASTLFGSGSLTINMGASDNVLYLQQLLGGSGFAITVNGSANDDLVKGAVNAVNVINGGDGSDAIRGSTRADTLNGGNGDDKIEGGMSADILTGGAGADTFRYQSASASGLGLNADQITDFAIGTDHLGFTLIDADSVTPGDQPFSFIGTAAFANTGVGQIHYLNSGADLLVQVDADGNGVADMDIVLNGLFGQALTANDFLL